MLPTAVLMAATLALVLGGAHADCVFTSNCDDTDTCHPVAEVTEPKPVRVCMRARAVVLPLPLPPSSPLLHVISLLHPSPDPVLHARR